MEKLVNLFHLDARGTDSLKDMPNNLSMLTNLQTLSVLVLGEEKGYQIRELRDLSRLKGQLCISGLKNIVEPEDAWMAKLCDKSRLEKLEMHWIMPSEQEELRWRGSLLSVFENRRQEVEEIVLQGLQPSKNLKELTISFYCGAMLANWVGDLSLSNLQSLRLEDCPNLLSLPSIGKLPLLKKVGFKGLDSVTSVGVEFFGQNTRNAFSSLEVLEFVDMPKWEKWNLCEVDDEARRFPRLRELLIQNCPLLLGSIPENLPSLEKLTIRGCEKLTVSIQRSPMLSESVIGGCHEVVYNGFAEDSLLKRVCFRGNSKFSCAAEFLRLRSIKGESLEISNCQELCSFRENNWRVLTRSISIGTLSIGGCPQIVSIGAEEEREELMHLKIPYGVQKMQIISFSRLENLSTTLHSLSLLRKIELENCPKLISLARSNLPLTLKVLEIRWCLNLESLMLDEGENINSNNACVLRQLYVMNCPSLKRINRSELPSSLKQLRIESCSQLESIAQEIQDNSSLQSIHIRWCNMIKELPQGLNKLKHLHSIEIDSCSNLICFPQGGLPTANLKELRLGYCKLLQSLPENMYSLNCIEELEITDCPNVTALPVQGIPTTNLKSLFIGGANICKAIREWGRLHTLTSLQSLCVLSGCREDAVSFPEDVIGMMLPSSLTSLGILNFPKLEILSSNGFRNLTCLEFLSIHKCPNLKYLPEKNMLSSLLKLDILLCPMIEERYKRDKGPDWSSIANIPYAPNF